MERQILSMDGVLVTDRRIVIGSAVYPVANVSSVRAVTTKAGWALVIALVCIAIILAMCAPYAALLALGGATARAYYVLNSTMHIIVLGAAGGEIQAFQTPDGHTAAKVYNAVNDALFGGTPC